MVEGVKAKARNPYLLVYFKAIEAKRAAMRELGFTPAARVGLPTNDSRDADSEDQRWQWLVELREKNKAERARLAKRKTKGEEREPFRFSVNGAEGRSLRSKIEDWAKSVLEAAKKKKNHAYA